MMVQGSVAKPWFVLGKGCARLGFFLPVFAKYKHNSQ